ncbi:DUF5681 domain-containing protein [Bradyrhizobium sp. RT11b]|uniref:DUF5681 domain-containing protein n=1 Tax=Bradyrhizobium sp. RT11b TaxID=3156332 RepID=UPI003396E935
MKPDDAEEAEKALPETQAPAAPAKNRAKTGGGKFQKGKSGNPSGRKPGSRNKKTLMLEHMSDDDRVAIVSKIIRQAKRGDRLSQKMIVDRIEPPRKGRAAPFALPAIKTAGDVVTALEAVTAAMAAGLLSPAEAVEIAGVVELQRRAIEATQMEARLKTIEQRMDGNE